MGKYLPSAGFRRMRNDSTTKSCRIQLHASWLENGAAHFQHHVLKCFSQSNKHSKLDWVNSFCIPRQKLNCFPIRNHFPGYVQMGYLNYQRGSSPSIKIHDEGRHNNWFRRLCATSANHQISWSDAYPNNCWWTMSIPSLLSLNGNKYSKFPQPNTTPFNWSHQKLESSFHDKQIDMERAKTKDNIHRPFQIFRTIRQKSNENIVSENKGRRKWSETCVNLFKISYIWIVSHTGERVPQLLATTLHRKKLNKVAEMDYLYMSSSSMQGYTFVLVIKDDSCSYIWLQACPDI